MDELLDELLCVEVVGWGVVGSGEFDVLLHLLWFVVAVQGDGVCFVAGRFLGGLLFDEIICTPSLAVLWSMLLGRWVV